MTIFYIDGIPLELKRPDIDRDGRTDTPSESIYAGQSQNTQDIIQPTEVGAGMEQLNRDNLDSETRMSEVDFRARLHPMEIPYILQIDSLVAFGVLPPACLMLTRQKKRLTTSINGEGRKELCEMMAGKKQQDIATASGGFVDKMKNFVGMRT